MKRSLTALASLALMATAAAQSASKPLNLKLSPTDLPASSSSAGGVAPTSITPVTNPPGAQVAGAANAGGKQSSTSAAPGVYYGDTSGRLGNTAQAGDGRDCDDSTYNQAQVHGSVTTGVFSGSHTGTGTFGGGEVNVSKAFGSCDDPHGGISISISGDQTNFNGRHRGSGY
jgi:hypothetical protein